MRKTRKVLIALLSLMLVLGALFALSACKKECKHEWDAATCTAPKTCKLCSATEGEALGHTGGTATCAEQAKCSRCNTAYGEKTAHDYAAATCEAPKTCKVCALTEGDALGHLDENKDHTCDRCTAQNVGAHEDADKDHDCDYCGAEGFGTHADVDPKDHKCDYCGAEGFGTHADADSNHICEYCGGGIGEHADANKDHVCDYGCNDVVGEHADANRDHVCDYGCAVAIGEHADADLDHACDWGCAVAIGEHADADKDHVCDYGCAVAIGEHADSDSDNDHDCDYGCGEMLNGHTGGTATCSVQATCEVCGVKYGALAAHDFNKQVESLAYVMTRANCTESAVYYYCCSVCGANEANPEHTFNGKGSDGHKFGAYTVRLSDGVQEHVRTCTVCYFEDAEACAYDPNTVVPLSDAVQLGAPATCLNPAKCSVCANEYGTAKGHEWGTGAITQAATCTTAGVRTYTCACTATKTEVIDPLGHAWDDGTETTPATCTVAGVMTYTCQNANCPVGEKTEPIAAKGHTPGEAATCTTAQICGECDATLVKALGHDYELTTQDATCTEARVDTYTCTRCSDSYTNTVGAPLGHSYNVDDSYEKREEGTCKYHTYTYCNGCEQYIPTKTVTRHEGLTAVIDPAPTCTTPGMKTVTCSGCELPADEKYVEVAIDTVNGHAWQEGEAVDGKRTDKCALCGEEKVVKTITADTELSVEDLANELESDNGSKFQMDAGVQELVGSGAKLSSGEVNKDDLNLTEEQKNQIGTVYEFVITKGDETISDFNGNKIKVTLPYNEPVDDADSVAIWFIGEDGQLTSIMATYNNGYVTFETEHFSKYTVTRLKPRERCALYGHSATYKVVGGSCLEDLSVLVYCVRCGEKAETVLWSANGEHAYEEKARQAATCEEAGLITYACACPEIVLSYTVNEDFKLADDLSNISDRYTLTFGACDHSYTETLPALKHAWNESGREDASCTAAGSVTYVCANDENHTYTQALPQLAHDLAEEITDPTCSAGGYTTHYCVNCDYSYVDSYTAPLAHNYIYDADAYENWDPAEALEFTLYCADCNAEMVTTFAPEEVVKQEIKASCAVAGQEKYFVRMTVNGEAEEYLVKTVILEGVYAHEFSDVINGYDEETHWMGCKCGAKTNEAEHEFGAAIVTKVATCKQEGQLSYVCEDCGYVKTEKVAKTEHSFVMGVCSACGAKAGKGFYVTLIESYKNVNGFALLIEDLVFEVEEDGELEGKITVNLAELMLYIEDGKLGGAAKGTIVIFNGPIENENATMALEAVIDGDYVYAVVSGNAFPGTKEMKMKYSVADAIAAMINSIASSMENMGGGNMGGGSVAPIGDSVNMDGGNTDASSPEMMPAMDEAMVSMMVGFMLETLVPTVDALLATNADSAEQILEALFAMIFTAEETDGGYVFTLDYEKLYALNENLATLPVAELIDLYFGENAYANLKEGIYGLLAMKLSEIPDFVASQGLDYEALIAKINELCAMMGAPAGFDIGEMIEDPDYGQLVIGMLLFEQENYTQMLDQIFGGMLPYAPFYALVMPEEEAQLKAMVDMIIATFEGLNISFSTNTKGEFISFDISAEDYVAGGDGMVITVSGSISFIPNGKIEVTWSDIVADINASIVPPAEDMKNNAPMIGESQESDMMEYKGEYYEYYAQYLSIRAIDYDRLVGVLLQNDCSDWMEYQAFFAMKEARYGMYTLLDQEGNMAYMLLKNEATGEIAEIQMVEEKWFAVLEDGTEIEIDPSLSETDPAAFFESVFGALDFEAVEGDVYPLYYYYNAATGEYADESQHDYSGVTEKLGKYCTDGIRYTYTCAHCGDSYSITTYGCEDTEEKRVDFSELGACGGGAMLYVCAKCGKVHEKMMSSVGDCTFGAPAEENVYAADGTTVIGKKITVTCSECGLVYVSWQTLENIGNCRYEKTEGETVIIGGTEIYSYESSYIKTEHAYEYSYEFLGERDCEDGVKIITTCKNCTLRGERTTNEHSLMEMERVALTGSCHEDAYVVYMVCPCGKNESVQPVNSCLYSGFGNDEEAEDGKIHNVTVWHCEECGLSRTVDKYTERDASTCTEVTYYREIFQIGDTLIKNYEYASRRDSHNYTVVDAVLDGGIGSSCEDGVTLYYECSDCHETYDRSTMGHEQYEKARYDLTDPAYGGALHQGYLIVKGCACGESCYAELKTLCEIDRTYEGTEPFVSDALETFETFDTDGFSCWYSWDCYRQACAVTNEECGFSIRHQTYWKQIPGQCVAARYETWQLGYDPVSGDCAYEVTFATGETTQYHTYNHPDYESVEEIVEQYPNGNPRVIIKRFSCADCGSTAYDKTTYDADYNIVARHYYAENNSDYGNYKVREERYEYVKGHEFRMYEYREYMNGEWEKWEYDGYCECNERYSTSYDKEYVRHTDRHAYSWGWQQQPTCSQDGIYGEWCPVCDTMLNMSQEEPAYDHDWQQVEEIWICSRCGMQNANGASGDVILEDLTGLYGNNEYYVAGYKSNNYVEYGWYVALYLLNGVTVEIDGEASEIVELYEIEVTERDDVRAVQFSIAAVKAAAEALGLSPEDYEVRLSFVPYGADDADDYGITFDENYSDGSVAISEETTVRYFASGEAKRIAICPETDGEWIIKVYTSTNGNLEVQDSQGNSFIDKYFNPGNGTQSVTLEAGETYSVNVMAHAKEGTTGVTVVLSPSAE
ncbi:MAG: hypothetical protein IJV87_02410 [Clostridia bacterium]|nr:hypothetical protein [Clostridia bacterium]